MDNIDHAVLANPLNDVDLLDMADLAEQDSDFHTFECPDGSTVSVPKILASPDVLGAIQRSGGDRETLHIYLQEELGYFPFYFNGGPNLTLIPLHPDNVGILNIPDGREASIPSGFSGVVTFPIYNCTERGPIDRVTGKRVASQDISARKLHNGEYDLRLSELEGSVRSEIVTVQYLKRGYIDGRSLVDVDANGVTHRIYVDNWALLLSKPLLGCRRGVPTDSLRVVEPNIVKANLKMIDRVEDYDGADVPGLGRWVRHGEVPMHSHMSEEERTKAVRDGIYPSIAIDENGQYVQIGETDSNVQRRVVLEISQLATTVRAQSQDQAQPVKENARSSLLAIMNLVKAVKGFLEKTGVGASLRAKGIVLCFAVSASPIIDAFLANGINPGEATRDLQGATLRRVTPKQVGLGLDAELGAETGYIIEFD